MKIVLVGYMGSGKSTIGKLLAKQLSTSFIDLDTYIETQTGNTISELFASKGEIYFRKQEHLALKSILENEDHFVIATGGGTPCYSNNMDLILTHTSKVFYLRVSIGELVKRLGKEKKDRPLIAKIADEDLPEFFGKHLFERSQFYNKATYTIACDTAAPAALVAEISEKLV